MFAELPLYSVFTAGRLSITSPWPDSVMSRLSELKHMPAPGPIPAKRMALGQSAAACSWFYPELGRGSPSLDQWLLVRIREGVVKQGRGNGATVAAVLLLLF